MKKSLIALAALAAVSAASAQSTVTISGLLDLGVRSVNAPAANADTKGVIATGGSATTAILIQGSEDLGGGMKANFRYEINPDLSTGGGMTGAGQAVTTTGSATVVNSYTGAQGYHFLGLSGGFGEAKIGRLNTGTLAAWGTASVFGTALGSGYSSAGQYVRYGTTATTAWNTAPTRFNNSVEYTTPKVANFTGRILFAPKINNVGGVDGTASGGATGAGANRAGATDISLAYAAGPLSANAAQQKVKIGDQGINALVGVGPTATTNSSSTLTTLAASYTLGAAKVQGGYWTEKQSAAGATAVDIKGYILGGKYTMGAIDLMASMARTNDNTTANVDRKIMGVGADYNLSKRSVLWARYENRDANSNVGTDATASGVTKTMAAGIRHNF